MIIVITFIYSGYKDPTTLNTEATKAPLSVANAKVAPVPKPLKKIVQKTPVKPKSPWAYSESKDEMSGKVTGYLVSYSKNTLDGWLNKSGKIIFGYTCGQGFYVRANNLGFSMDDSDCDQYSCKRTHYARVKFDDTGTSNIRFSVWEDDNDGMSLQKRSGYPERKDIEGFLIRSMKAHSTMRLEVELINTKGRQQIAKFDLTGFTRAYNQCN